MANPPIHIVVERGRVTLTGVVQSNVERMLAQSLAAQFGAFSVTNALKTDAEMRDLLEKSEGAAGHAADRRRDDGAAVCRDGWTSSRRADSRPRRRGRAAQ